MTVREMIDQLESMIEESPSIADMLACYASNKEYPEACEIDNTDVIPLCGVERYQDATFSVIQTSCVRFL